MRLLIVKTSSMGDVVHALPAVADAHEWALAQGVSLEIDWLVEPAFAALPELHEGVQQVHRLPWRKWRKALFKPATARATWQAMRDLRRTLRARSYDLVVDCQGLLKSAWWARQAGAPVAGYDRKSIREPLASLFFHQRHPVGRELHAVERCRRLMHMALNQQASPGARTDSFTAQQPSLPPPDFGLQRPTLARPYHHAELKPDYFVLIPNASRPEKHWPDPDWQAVGLHLAARGWQPVVLWGSRAEEAMAQRIAQGCGGWVPPFLTVEEAARLLAGAKMVVGLDTGFAHVAAAVGRPVVGIYCDHEPGLTGITGPAPGASLGGKGQRPSRADVLAAVESVGRAAGLF